MKCSVCNWQNRPGDTHCFSCGAALAEQIPAPTFNPPPGTAPKPSAWQPPAASQPQPQATGTTAEPTELARVLAALVDGGLLVLLTVGLVIAVTNGIQASEHHEGAWGWAWLLLMLAAALGPGVAWGWMESRGSTPGKRLLGLGVVGAGGEPLGVTRATLRQFMRFGLNVPMPFIFRFLERFIFGDQGLHNTLLNSYVVRRNAHAAVLHDFLAQQQHTRKGWRKPAFWLVLMPLIVAVAVLLSVWVYDAWRDWRNPEGAAARSSLHTLVRELRPLTKAAQAYHERTGQFVDRWEDLALKSLPDDVAVLNLDPDSGQITITLADDVAPPELAGHHLVWTPRLRDKARNKSRWLGWDCGSPDIQPEWLPRNCDDGVPAVGAEAAGGAAQ